MKKIKLLLITTFYILSFTSCDDGSSSQIEEEGLCPAIAAADKLIINFEKDLTGEDFVKIKINNLLSFDQCERSNIQSEIKDNGFYYTFTTPPVGYFNHTDNSSAPRTDLVKIQIFKTADCSHSYAPVVDKTELLEWKKFAAGCDFGYTGTLDLIP